MLPTQPLHQYAFHSLCHPRWYVMKHKPVWMSLHDDVTTWKHYPYNWPFVRGFTVVTGGCCNIRYPSKTNILNSNLTRSCWSTSSIAITQSFWAKMKNDWKTLKSVIGQRDFARLGLRRVCDIIYYNHPEKQSEHYDAVCFTKWRSIKKHRWQVFCLDTRC